MRVNKALAFGAVLVASTVLAAGANAQSKKVASQADIDRVSDLLQEVGFRATRDESATSPTIESKFGGVTSQIELLNCDDQGQNCNVLRFHSGFDTTDGIDVKIVNDWNYEKYFGRAYIDNENDPHIDLVVSFVNASDENIKDIIDWWDVVIGDFTKAINW